MQLKKSLGILVLGIIFIITPSLVVGGWPCITDPECPSGYVCRNNECAIEKTISITVEVPGELSPGGGGGGGPTPTKVILKGKAYPNAFLTLLKNDKVAATFIAPKSGLFKKELTGLSGGIYTFGIWAEDTEGRRSVTLSFTISVLTGTTTSISGIFISPTISLTPTQVERGDKVNIFGQVFPESQVDIFVSSKEIVEETISDYQGNWAYEFDTTPLEEREHNARAKALYKEGEQSPFSQTIPFLVLEPGALICEGVDLNFDGEVNIVDFSILLYFWRQTNPSNVCADINFDGIVNIIDFSIMMYYWTD